MTCEEYPDIECPQCKAVTPDLDGFGVAYCAACGFCTHPSQSGRDGHWVCNACGKQLEPLQVEVLEHDGEPD